jgi:hypothetical protein
MPKYVEKTFSNQQLGMTVCTKLVMIMELRVVNVATSKSLLVESTMIPRRQHS